MRIINKRQTQLAPVIFLLFILQIVTLPFVLHYTFPAGSNTPDHVLTYTAGKLAWDTNTAIDQNGAAELSVFDNNNTGGSTAGNHVIFPGMNGGSTIRLENSDKENVTVIAVLYRIADTDKFPLDVSLVSQNLTETQEYVLPDGINNSDVIQAVTGKLSAQQISDLNIQWQWKYETAVQSRDEVDTFLGSKGNAEIGVGLYTVIADDSGSVIIPIHSGGEGNPGIGGSGEGVASGSEADQNRNYTSPQLSDLNRGFSWYSTLAVLLVSSAAFTVLLFVLIRSRRKKGNGTHDTGGGKQCIHR